MTLYVLTIAEEEEKEGEKLQIYVRYQKKSKSN